MQEVEASGVADPISHALQLVEFAGRYDPASHGGKHIAEPGGMPGQGAHDLTPTPPALERLVCAGHRAHELNWRVGGTWGDAEYWAMPQADRGTKFEFIKMAADPLLPAATTRSGRPSELKSADAAAHTHPSIVTFLTLK